MSLDATARRRWLGALALIGALAMLAAEATLFKGRLSLPGSLLYWLVCLALTGVALLAALLDLRALRRQERQQQRELLEETLDRIQTEAQSHQPQRRPGRTAP